MEVAIASRDPSGEYCYLVYRASTKAGDRSCGEVSVVHALGLRAVGEKRTKSMSRVAVTFILNTTFL